MSYELMIFDLGGVIVESDAEGLIKQVCQQVGREVEAVRRAVYDDDLILFELGQISPEAYYDRLSERLELRWSYEEFVAAWNRTLTEKPEVIKILQRLRTRYTIAALTNTNRLHLDYLQSTMPSLGIFEHWIASCDVGLRKPDPKIYKLALQRAGAAPSASVYVDDRPELVQAGGAVGLTAIRFEDGRQLEAELSALGVSV